MRPRLLLRKTTFPIRRRLNGILRPRIWDGGPPRGFFSEADLLRKGLVTGAFTPSTIPPPVPADSEVRNAGLRQHRHADWSPLWVLRENAFLAGPSFAHADSHGKICAEAVYAPHHAWSDPVWKRNGRREIRELEGDFTSIISRWNDGTNYFHWFMDGLTRLTHLNHFPSGCRIIVPRDLPPFAIRSIERLGLSNRILQAGDEDLRIERYWFSGPTMLSGCPDPIGTNWVRQAFLKNNQTPARQERLLYVDRKAATRGLENGEEIRNLFQAHGWETVDPGKLSLDEQIALFSEAKGIAGVHGAAMTNILWAKKGTRILEFMPSRRRNGCYAGISLVAGLEHEVLVCPSDREGAIHIPVPRIKKWLDAYGCGTTAP